ncbi:MAG: hypothetical protein GJ680_18140 [Alteromonadaceae bacterium]|nr:hypothetical protein [Alteromonadaceae bacterium]
MSEFFKVAGVMGALFALSLSIPAMITNVEQSARISHLENQIYHLSNQQFECPKNFRLEESQQQHEKVVRCVKIERNKL